MQSDNHAMHAEPPSRFLLKWLIARGGRVIAADYEVRGLQVATCGFFVFSSHGSISGLPSHRRASRPIGYYTTIRGVGASVVASGAVSSFLAGSRSMVQSAAALSARWSHSLTRRACSASLCR